MSENEKLESRSFPMRCMRTSAVTAGGVFLFLLAGRRTDWAEGYLAGAAASLLSMAGQMVSVPLLLGAKKQSSAKWRAVLLLAAKLPLYIALFYIAFHWAGRGPAVTLAMGAGILLVPVVITLKSLGAALTEGKPH